MELYPPTSLLAQPGLWTMKDVSFDPQYTTAHFRSASYHINCLLNVKVSTSQGDQQYPDATGGYGGWKKI